MSNPITGIEAIVAQDIAARQALGIRKYGQTVEENPLPLIDWLHHAYQESLDLPIYLRRAIHEIESGEPPRCRCENPGPHCHPGAGGKFCAVCGKDIHPNSQHAQPPDRVG